MKSGLYIWNISGNVHVPLPPSTLVVTTLYVVSQRPSLRGASEATSVKKCVQECSYLMRVGEVTSQPLSFWSTFSSPGPYLWYVIFCQCFCYPDSKDYPFISWTNFATISQKCSSICQRLLRRLGFSQNRCFTFISFLRFIRSFSGQIGLICPSFPSCWRYYAGRIVHSLYVVVWQTARKSCVHTGTRRWREPSRSGVTFHLVECLIFLFF